MWKSKARTKITHLHSWLLQHINEFSLTLTQRHCYHRCSTLENPHWMRGRILEHKMYMILMRQMKPSWKVMKNVKYWSVTRQGHSLSAICVLFSDIHLPFSSTISVTIVTSSQDQDQSIQTHNDKPHKCGHLPLPLPPHIPQVFLPNLCGKWCMVETWWTAQAASCSPPFSHWQMHKPWWPQKAWGSGLHRDIQLLLRKQRTVFWRRGIY